MARREGPEKGEEGKPVEAHGALLPPTADPVEQEGPELSLREKIRPVTASRMDRREP